MWTEAEKYYQIQEYLEGRLTGLELLDFEHMYKTDLTFKEEVEQHRLANEAIVDHYLLDVKATTQQVLKKKSIERNGRNWGLGLGTLGFLAGALYLFYPTNPAVENPSTAFLASSKTEILKKDSLVESVEKVPVSMPLRKGKVLSANNSSSANNIELPTENSRLQQVNVPDTTEAIQKRQKPVAPFDISSKPIASNSSLPVQTNSAKPKDELGTGKGEKKNSTSKEPIDLIFNPLLGEQAYLPVDENFNGELDVFDGSGALIFKCAIQNGYPNTWDGKAHSGGMASAGQYGFTLRSTSGEERVGYITVAK